MKSQHYLDQLLAATKLRYHDIDGAGAVGGQFQEGDAVPFQSATKVTIKWLNMMQGEFKKFLTEAGITQNDADNTQVWQSMKLLFMQASAWLTFSPKAISVLNPAIARPLTTATADPPGHGAVPSAADGNTYSGFIAVTFPTQKLEVKELAVFGDVQSSGVGNFMEAKLYRTPMTGGGPFPKSLMATATMGPGEQTKVTTSITNPEISIAHAYHLEINGSVTAGGATIDSIFSGAYIAVEGRS